MEIRTFAWQIPFEKSIQMDDFPLQRTKSSKITNGRFFFEHLSSESMKCRKKKSPLRREKKNPGSYSNSVLLFQEH